MPPSQFRLTCIFRAAGIPPELLPAFRRHSTGIPAGILPELLPAFRRNSAGIVTGIPLVFRTTPAGIPPEFLARILLEFQNLDRILTWKTA